MQVFSDFCLELTRGLLNGEHVLSVLWANRGPKRSCSGINLMFIEHTKGDTDVELAGL
jgi:hypothetical protein